MKQEIKFCFDHLFNTIRVFTTYYQMDTDTLVVLFGLFGFAMQSFWAHSLYKTNVDINKKMEQLEIIVNELGDGDNDRDDRIDRIHDKLDELRDNFDEGGESESRSQMSAPSVPDIWERVQLTACEDHASSIDSVMGREDSKNTSPAASDSRSGSGGESEL